MTVRRISEILEAKVVTGQDQFDLEVSSACGADLMSDVMAFVKEKVVLLTGLANPQAIRTADLLDIRVVVLVRGKYPTEDIVTMSKERGWCFSRLSIRCSSLAAGSTKRGFAAAGSGKSPRRMRTAGSRS